MPKLEIIVTRHLPQHVGADNGIDEARVHIKSPTAVANFINKVDHTSVLTLWTSPLRRCISTALRLEERAMREGIVVGGITRDNALSETNWMDYLNDPASRAQKLSGVLNRASSAAVTQAQERNATLVLVTHHPIIPMLIEQVDSTDTPDINYLGYNLLRNNDFETMSSGVAHET